MTTLYPTTKEKAQARDRARRRENAPKAQVASNKWKIEHPAAVRCSKEAYTRRNRKREVQRVTDWRKNNRAKRRRTDAALRARKRDAGQILLPLTANASAPVSVPNSAT